MINRRQILCSAAAMLAGVGNARRATYDLIIKVGRVIDPSVGLDGIRDVAISGGRIVAVEAGITGDATETIDAVGKIVAPGLIDIHTHAGRGKDSPALALQDGVTGFVDAGSGGPDNIDEIAAVVRGGPQIGRALLNIATRTGFTGGELMDINRASRNRNYITPSSPTQLLRRQAVPIGKSDGGKRQFDGSGGMRGQSATASQTFRRSWREQQTQRAAPGGLKSAPYDPADMAGVVGCAKSCAKFSPRPMTAARFCVRGMLSDTRTRQRAQNRA
jgi:hypothetical protein